MMTSKKTMLRLVTALLGLPLGLSWSAPAQAYCTYSFNPWGPPVCDLQTDQATCEAALADELEDLSTVFHAIPVWVNTGATTFLVDHPNAQCDEELPQLAVHRSVAMTGIPTDAFIQSVQAAIGIWNAAAIAGPQLIYAGEVSGDTSKAENRNIGITIDAYDCWTRAISNSFVATGSASAPARDGDELDPGSYRARIAIAPHFHGLQPANALVETCDELDPSLQARPRVSCGADAPPACDPDAIACSAEPLPFLQKTVTAVRGAGSPDIVGILVHELGHTLGLDHNFFPLAGASAECGLGEQVETGGVFGAMSYEAQKQSSNLRIDDVLGATALFGTGLPLAWPVIHAQRADLLPSGPAHELGLLGLPDASAPVRLSPGGQGDDRTTALAFPDADRVVRVFTLTGDELDMLPAALTVVDPDPVTGVSHDPVAVAYAPPSGMVDGTLLVAWNVEAADSQFVQLRWATRATSDAAWTLHGPQAIDVNTVGQELMAPGDTPTDAMRRTEELGLAYDATHDDFVLTLSSHRFSTAVAVLDRDGVITRQARELVGDPGGFPPSDDLPVASHNMIGTPTCIANADASSTCVLPVASSAAHPEQALVTSAGLVRFDRDTPVLISAIEQELLAGHSTCVLPDCPDFTAVGGATIAWSADLDKGWVGYLDPGGDMDWHEFVRGPGGVPEFTDLPWQMPGNGMRLAGALNLPDAEQIVAFNSAWPVAPRRPASVGVAATATDAQVDVVRQHRQTACGDGFLDAPPFGTEDCDGGLTGQTCASLGFIGGTLACSAACTFDTSGCEQEEECEPGTPGCPCLDADQVPPDQGPLPGGGTLGDGHYCLDDVAFGGWDRCVQQGNTFVCDSCVLNNGATFCPCDTNDGCVEGGQQCTFACDTTPCSNMDAALEHGYCFATGEEPEDGGVPDWFFDAYCAAYASDHVCNFNNIDGNHCVPLDEDDSSSCVL